MEPFGLWIFSHECTYEVAILGWFGHTLPRWSSGGYKGVDFGLIPQMRVPWTIITSVGSREVKKQSRSDVLRVTQSSRDWH